MEQFDFTKEYILENDAARLIPLKKEHSTSLKSIVKTPEIWTYFLEDGLGDKNFQTYFQNALQQKENLKEYPFAIFDKSKQQLAGMTRLYEWNENLKTIKLGHTWLGKDFWGTGLNKHCKHLLFAFVFEQLEAVRIGFGVHGENVRSLMALKKLGVKKEGVLRDFLPQLKGEGRTDLILLSILKNEWFATS